MRKIALIAAAALVASATALAQASAPAPAAPPPQGGQQMPPEMMQMMQKQARIMEAQKKALEDPAIEKKRDALQTYIEGEIVKEDKSAKATLDRMHELEKEVKAAADKGDTQKGQQLMQEAGPLVQKLDPLMKKVMARPEVEKKLKAFEADVERKMAAIDPEVPKLMKEMEDQMKKMGGHGGKPHGG